MIVIKKLKRALLATLSMAALTATIASLYAPPPPPPGPAPKRDEFMGKKTGTTGGAAAGGGTTAPTPKPAATKPTGGAGAGGSSKSFAEEMAARLAARTAAGGAGGTGGAGTSESGRPPQPTTPATASSSATELAITGDHGVIALYQALQQPDIQHGRRCEILADFKALLEATSDGSDPRSYMPIFFSLLPTTPIDLGSVQAIEAELTAQCTTKPPVAPADTAAAEAARRQREQEEARRRAAAEREGEEARPQPTTGGAGSGFTTPAQQFMALRLPFIGKKITYTTNSIFFDETDPTGLGATSIGGLLRSAVQIALTQSPESLADALLKSTSNDTINAVLDAINQATVKPLATVPENKVRGTKWAVDLRFTDGTPNATAANLIKLAAYALVQLRAIPEGQRTDKNAVMRALGITTGGTQSTGAGSGGAGAGGAGSAAAGGGAGAGKARFTEGGLLSSTIQIPSLTGPARNLGAILRAAATAKTDEDYEREQLTQTFISMTDYSTIFGHINDASTNPTQEDLNTMRDIQLMRWADNLQFTDTADKANREKIINAVKTLIRLKYETN